MVQEGNFAQLEKLAREPLFIAVAIALGAYAVLWLRIFRRTGLSPVLGALMVVPPLTLLLPFYMAFARWPLERPMLRTKVRKAPIQTVARRAIQRELNREKPTLTVPGFHHPAAPEPEPEGKPPSVYAGRDYVPMRLRHLNVRHMR